MKFAVVTYWANIDDIIYELYNYDKIFACEKSAVNLLNKGIKLEKVISDFDSIDDNIDIHPKFIKVDAEKDKTDGRIILEYIKLYYNPSIVVLYNEFCGRVEHSLSLLSFFELFDKFYIKTPFSFFYLLKENFNNEIRKNNNYKYISFLPLEKIHSLSIKNLKYSGEYEFIDSFSDFTLSNEFLEDSNSCCLFFKKGKILAIFSN